MSAIDDGDLAGVPLLEELSDSPQPQKKRKRSSAVDDEAKKAAKKARRKAKKPKDIDETELDTDLGINHAIGKMSSSLMADHIAQRTRRFRPELSLVEAEDGRIPENCITDTTSFPEPRTTTNLPDFLERFSAPRRKKESSPTLSDAAAGETKGAPHTLVITAAGIRAADLTRALRKFQTKECKVAKLFAKHIKMQEAVAELQKTSVNIAVGTPQRVMDLLEHGALSLTHLERIIVDASHIDQKKRGVLDMKELHIPLVKLLTRGDLKERYGMGGGKGTVELLFY